MVKFEVDVPFRQYMEAVRDGLYMWEVANDASLGAGGSLAHDHPMVAFIRSVRQDLALKFVGRNAGEE